MKIELKKHGAAGTIILNRVDKRNALDPPMLTDLIQALDDFHGEKKVRALVLTGAGSTFSAGTDLSSVQAAMNDPNAEDNWHDETILLRELIEKMLRYPKPIIAAVNGPAFGVGAALVLGCDLVIASHEAAIAFPEPKRGLVAAISAPLLVYRIGASAATSLLLTARVAQAEELKRLGIVHEIVANELLWARAHELSNEIATLAPESIQLTKKILNETIGETLETYLFAGAAAMATARTTDAAKEGIAAFLEKRSPKWL